jgi:glycolate oxidase FAD binding subunit
MTVVEPATPQDAARVLADASASRQSVLVAGGRTKLAWGRTARPADLLLSTRGLTRLVAHAAGDLTATVEAGMTLAALNEQLARHGQWLPLESSFDEATVGGALATNDSGPLRQRFGAPRDLLIGITLATTGGQVVKAGGKVVKNVAGYDLGKLVTGSFGSLAVIVDATFKLSPRPAAFATRRFRFVESRAAAAATLALAHGPLDLFALDLHRSNLTTDVLVRFGSPSAAAVEEQAACAETLAPGADVSRYSGADEESYWRQHRRRPWAGEAAVLSLSWLPAQLADVLAVVDELRDGGAAVEFVARAGVGSGLLRTEATGPAVVALTTSLRARRDLFQHVAVLRADDATRGAIDVWPDAGARGPLLAAVKRAFDPGDILNAGRGPI